MATLLPNLSRTPFSHRLEASRTLKNRFGNGLWVKQVGGSLRKGGGAVMLGYRPAEILSNLDGGVEGLKEAVLKAESLIYTVADAVVANSDVGVGVSGGGGGGKQNSDWLSGITFYMESVLKVLKNGLSTLHVPYSYGFAIILLTVLVKAATFPLTKKQVESAMAMKSLQPQIKAIQERYAGDQERIQLETARLYKLANINPLAGCLPTLATIPVWIGLYRALSNVADEGLLTEGFFWIPTLSGPTTIAARQNGSGISWLFPFVDGHPPLGWNDTFAYLVLPALLIASQYISLQIMQSSQQSNDPNMKTSQAITKFLPLMIGYFALSVPSGLSLYWLTNNVLSTAQQVWLQKMGGARNPMIKLTDVIKEEPPQILNPSLELKAEIEATQQENKSTVAGPKPGERFRLLKEEEARRKQQREEQKRRAQGEDVSGALTTINGNVSVRELNEASTSTVESNIAQPKPNRNEEERINDIGNKEGVKVDGLPSMDKEITSTQGNERQ